MAQPPAGMTEGMDPAIARRMALEPTAPVVFTIPPATNEWLTWGYDQERTGWNRAETSAHAEERLAPETGSGRPSFPCRWTNMCSPP